MMIEATPIPSSDQDIEPSRKPTRHARSCGQAGGDPDPAGGRYSPRRASTARRSAREGGYVV
jgi:hypothetical protein